MNCKNCEAKVEGAFCSNCGQKADTHRISFSHLMHEVFHFMSHADRGILLLMREMLIRPGFVVREYLDGKRKKYFSPINFLFITAALEAYVTYKSGYYAAISQMDNSQNMSYGPVYEEMMRVMINNGKVLNILVIVPALSLFTWLFFRKDKYNYSENLTLHAFVNGMVNLSNVVIFVPLYLLFSKHISYIQNFFQVIFLGYLIISYKQFFRRGWAETIIKAIAIMFLFIFLYWLVLIAIVLVKMMLT